MQNLKPVFFVKPTNLVSLNLPLWVMMGQNPSSPDRIGLDYLIEVYQSEIDGVMSYTVCVSTSKDGTVLDKDSQKFDKKENAVSYVGKCVKPYEAHEKEILSFSGQNLPKSQVMEVYANWVKSIEADRF